MHLQVLKEMRAVKTFVWFEAPVPTRVVPDYHTFVHPELGMSFQVSVRAGV